MKAHIFDEHISKTDYGIGVVENSSTRAVSAATFVEPIASPTLDANSEDLKRAEKPKKKLRDEAHEKIESILNTRTFVVIAGATLLLGLYIYNVISINRLAGETEALRQKIDEAKSLNVEIESELKALERSERIGREAFEKLGLRISTAPPIELKK
ncbi:MAG: FtsL-like putative cell division protein [Chloroherpetonaceae bacterium]